MDHKLLVVHTGTFSFIFNKILLFTGMPVADNEAISNTVWVYTKLKLFQVAEK